jgi:hypothetical protein
LFVIQKKFALKTSICPLRFGFQIRYIGATSFKVSKKNSARASKQTFPSLSLFSTISGITTFGRPIVLGI